MSRLVNHARLSKVCSPSFDRGVVIVVAVVDVVVTLPYCYLLEKRLGRRVHQCNNNVEF